MKAQRTLYLSLMAVAASVMVAGGAMGDSAKFTFDNGIPKLTPGQMLPFEQQVPADSGTGVFRARFTSPDLGAFAIQTQAETGVPIHVLDGNFLWPNSGASTVVDVRFDRFVTGVSLTFVTLDLKPTTSPIHLLAYQDSTWTPPVGMAAAEGVYGEGVKFPHGQLSYSTTGRPFDVIRVYIDPGAAQGFALDNISVVADYCQADFDGDDALLGGVTSVQDIFAFVDHWFHASYRADFNHDGTLNVYDVLDFLNAWFAGCP